MARIKGGMNAKKKHNRTLKLAKGYRGARWIQRSTFQTVQSGKTVCHESPDFCIRWKKAAQTSDETALDRPYQCSGKNERSVLQQVHARSETGKC